MAPPSDSPPARPTGAARPRFRAGARRVLIFLAWRNLWRNRLRSALTLAMMAVGLMMMIVTAALQEGLIRKFLGYATDLRLGHIQLHRQAFIDDQDLYALLPSGLVEHLGATTGHAFAPRVYAAGLASSGDASRGVLLRGIDPMLEPRVTSLHTHLREGAFELGLWKGGDGAGNGGQPDPPVYSVIIGNRLKHALQLGLGDELVLITQAADGSIGNGLFRVAGILKPLEPGFDRSGVLMSIEAFQSLMFLPDGVHELAAVAGDPSQVAAAQARIEDAVLRWPGPLPDAESGAVRVRRWDEINPGLADMLSLNENLMSIVMGIIFGIAGLGMLNTVLMAIHERRREFGMLLAMGMSRARLLAMVLLESFFLALLAAALGAALGSGWALWLQRHGLDFSGWLPNGLDWAGVTIDARYEAFLTAADVWRSAVLMLAIVMAAALIPAWRTVRYRPAEVMHP